MYHDYALYGDEEEDTGFNSLLSSSVTPVFWALERAVKTNNLDFVQFLVEKQVDVFVENSGLFHRSIRENNAKILDCLLKSAYANLQHQDESQLWRLKDRKGQTFLEQALYKSRFECLSVVLRWRANNYTMDACYIFCFTAEDSSWMAVTLIAHLYPQCLQEDWLVKYHSQSHRKNNWDVTFISRTC